MATMFGFHACNQTLLDAISGGGDDDQGMTSKTREFVSAFLVGIEASLLLSPLELVRIQGQNRGKGGLLEASRCTLSEIGARGVMTTGMHACMQREAKYCVGQFALIGAISSAIADWAAAHRFDASPSPSAASASASSAPSVFSSAGVATSPRRRPRPAHARLLHRRRLRVHDHISARRRRKNAPTDTHRDGFHRGLPLVSREHRARRVDRGRSSALARGLLAVLRPRAPRPLRNQLRPPAPAPLRGGRLRWRMRKRESFKLGSRLKRGPGGGSALSVVGGKVPRAQSHPEPGRTPTKT